MLGVHAELWANKIGRFQQNKFPTEGSVARTLAIGLRLPYRKQPSCLRDPIPKDTNKLVLNSHSLYVPCLCPTDSRAEL